jgi:hypothetical protein
MKRLGLTNNQLKIIAMLAMLMDHVGRQLLPQWTWMLVMGRLAFPIFAYMIAEGCRYTRHKARYLLMIAGLAAVCQGAYYFTTGSLYQNILVTFTLSIGLIFAMERFVCRPGITSGAILTAVLAGVLALCLLLPRKTGGEFAIDYGLVGVLLPVAVRFAPGKWGKLSITAVMLVLLAITMFPLQWYGLLALPLLALYNGQRGKWKLKYLFYIFYPAHLLGIYLLQILIWG